MTHTPTIPQPLIGFQRMPGHLIRRMQQIAVAIFTDQVTAAGYDLTPVQFAALAAIHAAPGCDQATLAGLIAYDRVTIGGVTERLIQKGLISREVSAQDRRARVLTITPTGTKTLQAVMPVVASAQEKILSGLTGEEQEQLITLLTKAVHCGNEQSRSPLRPPVSRP